MADNDPAISKREPLDLELWYVEMYTESGYNSFIRHCDVEDSRLWLHVPREPMVIHIERPLVAGDTKDLEASITVDPGTEARHNSAARRPKRRRSSDEHSAFEWHYAAKDKHVSHHIAQLDEGGEVYNSVRNTFKMNDPTGPYQRLSKVARSGSATTDPARHTIPQTMVDRYKKYVSKKLQSVEDNNKPTEPGPRADVPGSNGTL